MYDKKILYLLVWLFFFCYRIDVKSLVNLIYLMFLRMWFGIFLLSVVECVILVNCKRKKNIVWRDLFLEKKLRNFIGWLFFFFVFWWLN